MPTTLLRPMTDGPTAADVDPGALQDHDRCLGARRVERVRAELEQSGALRVDPIDVLGWIECFANDGQVRVSR